MSSDAGAQIAVSLLAHIALLFVVNTFLCTTDIPSHMLFINATSISNTNLGVTWKVIPSANTEIYSVQLLISSEHDSDLTQASPILRNISCGTYQFGNLQPGTLYSTCVTAVTKRNIQLSKCINATTTCTGFSRLKLLTSSHLRSNNLVTCFLGVLVFVIFLFVVLFVYRNITQTAHRKKQQKYQSFTEGMFDQAYDKIYGVKRDQLNQPLLRNTITGIYRK